MYYDDKPVVIDEQALYPGISLDRAIDNIDHLIRIQQRRHNDTCALSGWQTTVDFLRELREARKKIEQLTELLDEKNLG